MPASAIAAQLYSVREFLKTPADIAKSLRRVKQIGYDAVQLSALGPIEPGELARMLQGEGLTCCATHVSLEQVREHPQQIIDDHRQWNCSYTAIGIFSKKEYQGGDWIEFARTYNQITRPLQAAGLSIGYHNHSHELARYDGQVALQTLIDNLSADIWLELDTYWVQHGGGDPAQWISKVNGRIPCVHLKDMAVTPQREQRMAAVGEGNLNWSAILAACRDAGTRWYIVEQDHTYGQDPFECLATSLRNLRAMGLQ